MPGPKTNERPVLRRSGHRLVADPAAPSGTRAQARYVRVSAYKAREVLDLVRGHDVERAREILRFCDRDVATVIGKVVDSAVANAEHNDEQVGEELYVSACFADEGPTLKRGRPRARGRATRIRKRTCHITVIVSHLPADELDRVRNRQTGASASRRARRAGQEAAEGRRRRRRGPAEETAETPAEETAETPAEETAETPAEETAETPAEAVDEVADETADSGNVEQDEEEGT
jgi:large subunit ribosomal protein L22